MKKEKWLIPVVVSVSAVLLVIFAVGAYPVYNYLFPMAEAIVCPSGDDITSVSLARSSDPSAAIEISDFATLLQTFRNTKPTRNWSVQDYPAAENYYTIEIDTPARQYRYFVYTEDSQVYVESPYEGVYQANQQILDLVAEHFED